MSTIYEEPRVQRGVPGEERRRSSSMQDTTTRSPGGSLKLGTLAGIEIRVHYTWLFAFILVAWSLGQGYFLPMTPGQAASAYWILGVLSALLLFGSVLVHELAHSLVAEGRGIRVHDITLFIFGGVSNITSEASSARDEFLIAVVGPLTSLVLAGLFWLLAHVLPPNTDGAAVAAYLSFANLLLAAFNIVPGFPLDGGRVLRAIIWAIAGDMQRATRIASYVGQAFAFLLITWGIVQVLGGNLFGGLWIAFIGWFLNSGAEASRQEQRTRADLSVVPVTALMDAAPPVAAPTLSVQEFVFGNTLRHGHRALPVVDSGRLLGMISITDVKHIPSEAWATTDVVAVMTPMPLRVVTLDADLESALEVMVASGVNQVPVVQDEHLAGMLSRDDILTYVRLAKELHLRDSAPVSSAVAA
jgi:Zn-dependent protease/CBS domain-containing protein